MKGVSACLGDGVPEAAANVGSLFHPLLPRDSRNAPRDFGRALKGDKVDPLVMQPDTP